MLALASLAVTAYAKSANEKLDAQKFEFDKAKQQFEAEMRRHEGAFNEDAKRRELNVSRVAAIRDLLPVLSGSGNVLHQKLAFLAIGDRISADLRDRKSASYDFAIRPPDGGESRYAWRVEAKSTGWC